MIDALVITHNSPITLNACVWSLAMQTRLPDRLVIANAGDWLSPEVGHTLDIVSELFPVVVRRVPNGKLGDVHAAAFAETHGDVWFLQDDVVAWPTALALLEAAWGEEVASVQPTVVVPDYHALPGEDQELPQEVSSLRARGALGASHRGVALGLLFRASYVPLARYMVQGQERFVDDALVTALEPRVVPAARVVHTRPEGPHIGRMIGMVRSLVLQQYRARMKVFPGGGSP